VYDGAIIAAHLIRKQNAHKWQVDYLLGMLDESYLLSLPRLKKDISLACDTSPDWLRILWCRWAATLLGWRDEWPEGHSEGFSTKVYKALKGKVFQFPKVEQDVVGRRLSANSPCTCTRQSSTNANACWNRKGRLDCILPAEMIQGQYQPYHLERGVTHPP
jgi:hypothetical protein